MNTLRRDAPKFTVEFMLILCCLALIGCEFEVPIASSPSRKVDERLLGDWISKDGKEKMKVRKLDDFVYVVSYNGDLFRAYHSDVVKTSFVSVQDIESPERKYAYLMWKLSEDGKRLGLRVVSDKVIPKNTKDSASVQKLLEKNLQNPELLGDEVQFTREK